MLIIVKIMENNIRFGLTVCICGHPRNTKVVVVCVSCVKGRKIGGT